MANYVVTAPYVTMKALDPVGGRVLRELYKGAPVPATADQADIDRLLDKGMLAEVIGPVFHQDPPPVQETDGKPVRPADNATKALWVDYAVARRDEGVSEADARASAEAMTKADLITLHG